MFSYCVTIFEVLNDNKWNDFFTELRTIEDTERPEMINWAKKINRLALVKFRENQDKWNKDEAERGAAEKRLREKNLESKFGASGKKDEL